MVEIQTSNARLATLVGAANPGATVTESGGVWTVSHASKLIITMDAAQKSGYSASYTALAWQSLGDLVTQGTLVAHTFSKAVIESTGDDAVYYESLQPDSDGTMTAAKKRALLW